MTFPVSSNAIDPDAEQRMLLGAILRDPQLISGLALLGSGHFSEREYGLIFDSVATRVATGLPYDLPALKEDFGLSGALDGVGGSAFLDHLASLPPIADIAAAIERILDLWQRRQLIGILEQHRLDVDECLLDARAFTSRASAQQIGQSAAAKTAEVFAVLQTILLPTPPMLAGPIRDVAKIVVMAAAEITELANLHVALAEEERRQGSFFADLRLVRSEQLRALLGEAAP